MELYWNSTLVGWIRDNRLDEYPFIHASIRFAELNPAMQWVLEEDNPWTT